MLKVSQNNSQTQFWNGFTHYHTPNSHTQVQTAIRQSIAEIEAQIKQLQVKLARQRALLSSNHALPVEILSRILGDHFNSTPDDALTHPNRLAPLAVCRYWRQTALSSSLNWTTLDFTARWNHPSQASDIGTLQNITTRLRRQFDRAGDRSMDLVIRYTEPRFNTFGAERGLSRNERVAKVASVLANSAHRFRSFAEFGISSLSSEDCFFMKAFANVKSNVLTRLRVRALGTLQISLPNLEILFIDGFVSLDSLRNLNSPNLQSLIVGGSIQPGHRTPGKFTQTLQRFPHLQNVTMICNANLLDDDSRHTSVKALRFHESIYPHSYTVPDSIRSLEGVCGFLQTFPNVDSLTFSSSIIYIYDDSQELDLQGTERIQSLTFEGSVDFGWRSTIDAFSAFSGVTHIKVDHARAGSVFEWDKGRGSGNLFLFELLKEVSSESESQSSEKTVFWSELEHLELVGVTIDQCSLNHLLKALEVRQGLIGRNGRGASRSFVLTTRQCSLALSTLQKPIPDLEKRTVKDVGAVFQEMQADMARMAQNFLHDAMA